jgi:hypothetical protein
MSLSSDDEVPHIFTTKSHLQLGEFCHFCNNTCQKQTLSLSLLRMMA